MIKIEKRLPFARLSVFIINIKFKEKNIPFEKGYICFKKNKYFFSKNKFDEEFLNLNIEKVSILDIIGKRKYKIGSISHLMGIDKDKEFEISILNENIAYECYYKKRDFKNLSTTIQWMTGVLLAIVIYFSFKLNLNEFIIYIILGIFLFCMFFSTKYLNKLYLSSILKKINIIIESEKNKN